jgi:hypothetical protein
VNVPSTELLKVQVQKGIIFFIINFFKGIMVLRDELHVVREEIRRNIIYEISRV